MGDSPDLSDMEDMVALCQLNVATAKDKPVSSTPKEHEIQGIQPAAVCSDVSNSSALEGDILTSSDPGKTEQLFSPKSLKPSAANHWQSLLGCGDEPSASPDGTESSTLIPVNASFSGEPAIGSDGVLSKMCDAFVFEWPPWFENGHRTPIEILRLSGILPSFQDIKSHAFIENWLTRSYGFRCEAIHLCDATLELLNDETYFFLILKKLKKVSITVDHGLRNAVRNLPAKDKDMMTANFEDAVCFAPNSELGDFAVRDLRDLRLLLNKAFSTFLHNRVTRSNTNLNEDNRQLLQWLQSNFDRVPTQLSTKVGRINSFANPAWRHVQLEYAACLTADQTLQSFCCNWMKDSLAFRSTYARNVDVPCLIDLLLILGATVSDLFGQKGDKRKVFRKSDSDIAVVMTAKDLFTLASSCFFFNIPDSVKQFCLRDAVAIIHEILSNLAGEQTTSKSDNPEQDEILGSVRRTLVVVEMLLDGEMDDALAVQLCDTLTNICRLAGRKRERLEPFEYNFIRTWPAYFPEGRLVKCSAECLPSGIDAPPHGAGFSEELINEWLTKSYIWRLKFFKLIEEFLRVDPIHLPEYSEACCLILARKLSAMCDSLQCAADRCAGNAASTCPGGHGIASLTSQLLRSPWASFVRKDVADLARLSQVTQLYVCQRLYQVKLVNYSEEIGNLLEKFALSGSSDSFLMFNRASKSTFPDPPWRFIIPKFSAHILGENTVGSVNYVWLTSWLQDSSRYRKLYQKLSLNRSEDIVQLYVLLLYAVRAQYLAKRQRGIIGFAVTAGRETLKLDPTVPENLFKFVAKDVDEIISDLCYALEVLITNLSECVVVDRPCPGTSLSEKFAKIDWVPQISRLRKLYGAELQDISVEPSSHLRSLENIVQDFNSTVVGDIIPTGEGSSLDISLDSSGGELETPGSDRSFGKEVSHLPENAQEYSKSGKPVAPIAPMQRGQMSDQVTPSPSSTPDTIDLDTELPYSRNTVHVYNFDWPEWCDARGCILDASLAAHVVSVLQSIAEIAVNTGLESTSNYRVLYAWFTRVAQFRSEYIEYANSILLVLQSESSNLRRTCLDLLVGKLMKMLNSVNQSVAQCKLLLTRDSIASGMQESDIFGALAECVSTGYFDKCFQDFCQTKNELVSICRDLLVQISEQNIQADQDLVQRLSENLVKAPDNKIALRREVKSFDPLTEPPWLLCRPYFLAEHFLGPDSPIGLAMVSDSLFNTWMDASLLLRQDLAVSLSHKPKTSNEKLDFVVKLTKRLKGDICTVISQLENAPLIEDCEMAPGDVLEAIYNSRDSLTKLCIRQPHAEIKQFCMDDMRHMVAIVSKVLRALVEQFHDSFIERDFEKLLQELDLSAYSKIRELAPLVDYVKALKLRHDDTVSMPMAVDDVSELAPPAPDYISRSASQQNVTAAGNFASSYISQSASLQNVTAAGNFGSSYISRSALQQNVTAAGSLPSSPVRVGPMQAHPVKTDFTSSPRSIPTRCSTSAFPAYSRDTPLWNPATSCFMPWSLSAFSPPLWYGYQHTTSVFEPQIDPAIVDPSPPLPVQEPLIPPPPPISPGAAERGYISEEVMRIPTPPGSARRTTNRNNPGVAPSTPSRSPGKLLQGFLNLVERFGPKNEPDTTHKIPEITSTKVITPVKPRFADKESVRDLVARLEQRVETAKRKAELDQGHCPPKFLKYNQDPIPRPGPSHSPDDDLLDSELRFLELELKQKCEKVMEQQEYYGQARRIFATCRPSELDDQILEFKTKADGAQRKLNRWEDARDKLNDLREDYFRLQGNLDELDLQKKLQDTQLQKLTRQNAILKAHRAIYRDLAISCEAKRGDHEGKHLQSVAVELSEQCERLKNEVKDWFKTGAEHKPLLLLVQWKLEDWLQQQRTYDVSVRRLRAYTEQLKFLMEKMC